MGAQDQSSSGVHRRYDADRLVWFESHDSAEAAMLRDKQIKEWKRDWKLTLLIAIIRVWIVLYANLSC